MKVGKIIVYKINDELRGGYLVLEDGRAWSFVAGERSGEYGAYHAGFAIEGVTLEKDDRKDGDFWVTIGDPKERGEGKPIKLLKATKCQRDEDGDMVFADEPTFMGALYSNGTGVLNGFLYTVDEDEEDTPPKRSSGSGSRQKKNTSSGKGAGGNKKHKGVDLW